MPLLTVNFVAWHCDCAWGADNCMSFVLKASSASCVSRGVLPEMT